MMLFSGRDRERLEAVDGRLTRIEASLPGIISAIEGHVKWCNKLQFSILAALGVVLFKLLFPSIHIGEGL